MVGEKDLKNKGCSPSGLRFLCGFNSNNPFYFLKEKGASEAINVHSLRLGPRGGQPDWITGWLVHQGRIH